MMPRCIAIAVALLFVIACGEDGSRTPRSAAASSGGERTRDAFPASPGAGGTNAPEDDGVGDRPQLSAAAKEDYEEGVRRMQQGQNRAAERALQDALAKDGRSYQVLYSLGVLADRAGNEARALEYYRQALRQQPDYEAAAAGMVAIYLRRNATAQAVTTMAPLAKQWPANLRLQVVYGNTLVHAGRLDEAEMVARKALRRNERYVPAMLVLVRASLKRGRIELAESVLEQALEIDEDHPEALFLRAQLYQQDERLADAMKHYRQAIEARPDYAEARNELGMQLLAGGNYNEALEQFERVQQLMPPQPEVLLNLGDAYRATRQWQKARAALQGALRLKSSLPEAHYNLGLLYMAAGDELPNMSKLESLQRAVKELGKYRSMKAGSLPRDDPSSSYLEDLERQIKREKRRLEREAQRKQTEAAP